MGVGLGARVGVSAAVGLAAVDAKVDAKAGVKAGDDRSAVGEVNVGVAAGAIAQDESDNRLMIRRREIGRVRFIHKRTTAKWVKVIIHPSRAATGAG